MKENQTNGLAEKLWETIPTPLTPPAPLQTGYAEVNGIKIYYTVNGSGEPLLLLHGGLGSTEYWGGMIQALSSCYKVICIDSRGHGCSTRDNQSYSFQLLASDTLAVMDHLSIDSASILGWSDGGNIGIDIAINHPEKLNKLIVLGANFTHSGIKSTVEENPVFGKYIEMAAMDYARLSKTPDDFELFVGQISEMWATDIIFTQEQLKSISIPVTVLHGEYDEAIKLEHSKELASLISESTFIQLDNLSHFAIFQDPIKLCETALKHLAGKESVKM